MAINVVECEFRDQGSYLGSRILTLGKLDNLNLNGSLLLD